MEALAGLGLALLTCHAVAWAAQALAGRRDERARRSSGHPDSRAEPSACPPPDATRAEQVLLRELTSHRLDRDDYRAAMAVLAEHDDRLHPLRVPMSS